MKNNTKKEIINIVNQLSRTRNKSSIWADIITSIACTIANSTTDSNSEIYIKREKEYYECISRLGNYDIVAKILALIINELDTNPEQDFLGKLYTEMNLTNSRAGQFFTPYKVCKIMSKINLNVADNQIKSKGWTTVNDPACGAGATLIAFANTLKEYNINYQKSALFVAQDIDRVAALMCYVQLSLLGCAGYIIVGDSLINPPTNDILIPVVQPEQEYWFTPLFFSSEWNYRKIISSFKENLCT